MVGTHAAPPATATQAQFGVTEALPGAPVATVLVIAYKMENTIAESLRSALAQTVPCEIIVSDDSSGDAGLERARDVLKDYRGPHRVTVRSTARNLGLCAHLTELAGLATTPVLVFLAADDIAYPMRVEKLVNALKRHPQAQIVGSAVDDIDAEGKLIAARVRGQKPVLDQQAMLRAGKLATVLGASMAVRRELFTAFPPLEGKVEDNALSLRAVLVGELRCLPEALVGYRRHDNNLGSWVFDRSERSIEGYNRRQRRVAAMYREVSADQARCVAARPDLPAERRERGLKLAKLYALEADMREAILETDRRKWLRPLWAGLCFPGLRRKSLERAAKLLLPRRLFGMKG